MLAAVDYFGILLASIAVLAVAVVGFFVVGHLRREAHEQSDDEGNIGFTLADLRRLRAEGQIDEAEYERAKSKMVEAQRAARRRDDERLAEEARRAGVVTEAKRVPPDVKDMDLLEEK